MKQRNNVGSEELFAETYHIIRELENYVRLEMIALADATHEASQKVPDPDLVPALKLLDEVEQYKLRVNSASTTAA